MRVRARRLTVFAAVVVVTMGFPTGVATASAQPAPAVAFTSSSAIRIASPEAPAQIGITNTRTEPTTATLLVDPWYPELLTLTVGCAVIDPTVEALASTTTTPTPTTTTVVTEPFTASVLEFDIPREETVCVTIALESEVASVLQAQLLLTAEGTVPTSRALTLGTTQPTSPPPKKVTAEGNVAVGFPNGREPAALHVALATGATPGAALGYLDGPDGLHAVRAGTGEVTVQDIDHAGAYTGTIDTTPGVEGGDTEMTLNVSVHDSPWWAFLLLALGIGLTSLLAWLATGVRASLKAEATITELTADAYYQYSRIVDALSAQGLDEPQARRDRWRLVPTPGEQSPPQKVLAMVWAARDADWTDETAAAVAKQVATYQSAVNAGVRAIALRAALVGLPGTAPSVRVLDDALWGDLDGGDAALDNLKTRVAGLPFDKLGVIAAISRKVPERRRQIQQAPQDQREALTKLLDVVVTQLGAADPSTDLAALKTAEAAWTLPGDASIDRALIAMEEAATREQLSPVVMDKEVAPTPDVADLRQRVINLRNDYKMLSTFVLILAMLVVLLVGFNETYLSKDSWGTWGDVVATLTWAVGVSGVVQLTRVVAPVSTAVTVKS